MNKLKELKNGSSHSETSDKSCRTVNSLSEFPSLPKKIGTSTASRVSNRNVKRLLSNSTFLKGTPLTSKPIENIKGIASYKSKIDHISLGTRNSVLQTAPRMSMK